MTIEIHLTTTPLLTTATVAFEQFCTSIQAKPIVIVLPQGQQQQQPMISKVVSCANLQELEQELKNLKLAFEQAGYAIARTKLEVPPWEQEEAKAFVGKEGNCYFEWHGKVLVEEEEKVSTLVEKYGGRLSKNVLKKDPKAKFITLREYGKEEAIQTRIAAIKAQLATLDVDLLKEELEYCIFDSNSALDKGWIS